MVQEPRGIILCTSEISLFSKVFMYLTMFVSDWNLQKAYHHAYYRPQTKFAKAMFLHVSVILSIGGRGAWSPGGGVPGPGGGCVETPPPGRLLLRVVRILLECILVSYVFWSSYICPTS